MKALSLGLLLLKGVAYAPVRFLAALLVDLFIYGAAKSAASTVATSAVVAIGYAALAVGLTRGLGFALDGPICAMSSRLLVTVPAGTFVIACFYCGFLVLFGDLSARRYWEAVPHLWVGDTVGIIIILPVAMAFFGVSPTSARHKTRGAADPLGGLSGWGPDRIVADLLLRGSQRIPFLLSAVPPGEWIAMRTGSWERQPAYVLSICCCWLSSAGAAIPRALSWATSSWCWRRFQRIVLGASSTSAADRMSSARAACRGGAHDKACDGRCDGRFIGAPDQPAAIERRHVPSRRSAAFGRPACRPGADCGVA